MFNISEKIKPINSKCKQCGKKCKVLLVHSIPLCFRCITEFMTAIEKEKNNE